MSKLNYKEVIDYFDEIGEDMAELILGMIKDKLEAKAARRAKISANLKKARAAKGTKVDGQTQAAPVAQAPAEPAHRRPGRPARVETPQDANQALTTGQ